MKISIIPLCYIKAFREGTMSQEDWIKEAVELGLDGIELYEPFLSSLDSSGKASLADAVHNAGLEVAKYASGCYAHPSSSLCNPEDRERAIAYIRKSVDEAIIFRTNIVRVVSGIGNEGLEHEVVLQSVADGLKACLDYAEQKQVMLAFEDHFSVGTNIDDFMKILELVGDDRLKVDLDTANVGSENIVELTELVKDRVVHTHCSELLNNRHGIVIGKGDVDFKSVLGILKNNDYDGWVSLEPLAGGRDDLEFSVNHIRDTWNSL